MKRMILTAALLAPVAALAEEPATLILPTPIVSAVAQYLSQRPYAEVAQMVDALRQCVAVQVPGQHGECPAVEKAMQAKAPPPAPTPKD